MLASRPRVVLYVRRGCHLCDSARAVLAEIERATGTGWVEVEIDHDLALARRYSELVPVVVVDGVQQGFWRLDRDRLLRALGAAADETRGSH